MLFYTAGMWCYFKLQTPYSAFCMELFHNTVYYPIHVSTCWCGLLITNHPRAKTAYFMTAFAARPGLGPVVSATNQDDKIAQNKLHITWADVPRTVV
jgi:hypothetical protein